MSLRQIEARLHGMRELREVVGAMRALSAIRLRQADEVVGAVRRYYEVVGKAFARAATCAPEGLAPVAPAARTRLLVVFGSEHGFVGGLNRRLFEAATAVPDVTGMLVVGSRIARIFEDEGRPVAMRLPMAAQAGAIDATARHVAAALAELDEGTGAIDLIYPVSQGQGRIETVRAAILPLAPPPLPAAEARNPPDHYLPVGVLLTELVGEYALAKLAEAVVETLLAVNQARLRCVQSAYDNIGRRLEDLERLAHRIRQDEITTEVLDVAAGAEAALGQ